MKSFIYTLLTIGLSSTTFANTLKYNVTSTSDYVWRGQSQTSNRSALQGGIDYEALPKLNLSIWSSNVEPGTEIDYVVRYTQDLNEEFKLGVGGTLYYYTKNNAANTAEVNIIGQYRNTTLSVIYTPNYFGSDTSSYYLELNSTLVFNEKEKLYLLPTLGYVTFNDEAKSGSSNHINYRLELAKDIDVFMFKIFFTDTNRKHSESVVTTKFQDQAFGVSVSKAF